MSHDDFDAPDTTGSENAIPSPLDPQPEPTTPVTPAITEIDDDFGLPK